MDHLSTRIRARWFVLTLALAGLATLAIMMAQGAQGASVADGLAIYQGTSSTGVMSCAGCHGADGNGSPKLTGITKSVDEIISKVDSGVMLSLYTSLSNDQKLSTACYVKDTFGDGIPSADEARCGVNQAPVANDQMLATGQDTPVGVTLTATDGDGDPLSYTVATGPSNGILSGTAPNLTYTPNTGFNGADSFTFTANDGTADSNTATIAIVVNAPPPPPPPPGNQAPVANDQMLATGQDTPVGVTLTATDGDGDPLSYTVATGPSNGILSGTAPNLTYTPNTGFNGADSFTFTANDGTADSNTATVTIDVKAATTGPTPPPGEGDSYRAGPAGWVMLEVENRKLVFGGVDSDWDWRIDERSDHELKIIFQKDGTQVKFKAELERGKVKIEVEVERKNRRGDDDDHKRRNSDEDDD